MSTTEVGLSVDDVRERGEALIRSRSDSGFMFREVAEEVLAQALMSEAARWELQVVGLAHLLSGSNFVVEDEVPETEATVSATAARSGKGARGIRRPYDATTYRALTVAYFSVTRGERISLLMFNAEDFEHLARTCGENMRGLKTTKALAEQSAAAIHKAKAKLLNDLSDAEKLRLDMAWSGIGPLKSV